VRKPAPLDAILCFDCRGAPRPTAARFVTAPAADTRAAYTSRAKLPCHATTAPPPAPGATAGFDSVSGVLVMTTALVSSTTPAGETRVR
jgi:hypothetical protein